MAEKTQFIDAESGGGYSKENSYDLIVLKQMQHCVDVLNEDMVGGTMKVRIGKQGQSENYIEDVREKIVNSVDTFRMLLLSFIKDEFKDELNKINKDISDFKDKLGQRTIMVPNRGQVKIKDLGFVPQEHPIWKAFSTFKADKNREIFEVLIKVYTKNKSEISAFSEE